MLINVGSYDFKFLENKIEKINVLNEIYKYICYLLVVLCIKNKIYRIKKKNDFFNYFIFKIGILIEVWFKVMNRKYYKFIKYIFWKIINFMCVLNF